MRRLSRRSNTAYWSDLQSRSGAAALRGAVHRCSPKSLRGAVSRNRKTASNTPRPPPCRHRPRRRSAARSRPTSGAATISSSLALWTSVTKKIRPRLAVGPYLKRSRAQPTGKLRGRHAHADFLDDVPNAVDVVLIFHVKLRTFDGKTTRSTLCAELQRATERSSESRAVFV